MYLRDNFCLDESFVGTQSSTSLVPVNTPAATPTSVVAASNPTNTVSMPVKKAPLMLKPKWHPPWKLYRVISGHLGWVRCCAVEPGNEWFATGSADRVIKVSV